MWDFISMIVPLVIGILLGMVIGTKFNILKLFKKG